MSLSTAKVEFSQDDLSDTTPTWTDISAYALEVEWVGGKSGDLDAPTAGRCTILLDNQDRRFEPDYSAGAYSPNIKPLRRFRITITADSVDYTQGIYYAVDWSVSYDGLLSAAMVTVTCVDGFGLLSLTTLPTLSPPDAATYADVIVADNPLAYYPLAESGGQTMDAITGPQGVYKGAVDHGQPNPVSGDSETATLFPIDSGWGRAKLDDVDQFHDAGCVSVEAVAIESTGNVNLAAGPFDTTAGDSSFLLTAGQATVYVGSLATAVVATGGSAAGAHHWAMTFDGSVLTLYQDGSAVATATAAGGTLVAPDANEYLYVGQKDGGASVATISHVAFYDYALTADQVSAHATAALNRGYAAETTGDRVAALATNALWSTAGITGGQVVTVEPRFQTGQSTLEEILLVAAAEQPYGMFYFDDNGDPAYQGSDYDTTVQATFDDGATNVNYTGIVPVYDDEIYNSITVSRDGGAAQTREDTASESAYGTRGYNQTGLIVNSDEDASLVAAGILSTFSDPMLRFSSLSLDGMTSDGRLQILTREIGDVIRVKVRTDTAEPIDVITRILGKQKSWTVDGNLTCTWTLARGFDASIATWRLGQVGYSELGSTTILG